MRQGSRWSVLVVVLVGLAWAGSEPQVRSQPEGQPPRILSLSFPRIIPPDGEPVRGELTFEDPDRDATELELRVIRAYDFAPLRFPVEQVQTESSMAFELFSERAQPVALSARLLDSQGHASAPWTVSFAVAGPDQEVAPGVYFMVAWGQQGKGPGQFNFEGPQGLRVGPDGNVYVVDEGNHRVQVFDPAGTYLTEWGRFGTRGAGRFNFPSDLAFAPNGNVYVTDSLNHRVQVFDPQLNYLFQWGSKGSQPGQFLAPRGLAITPAGEVFVADEQNGRVQVFDLLGNFLRQWGRLGSGPGEFDVIVGLDVDSQGLVYVADGFNHRVQVFDAQGELVRAWGQPGRGEGQFDDPVGVAVAPQGWVAVTDSFNDRVQLWTRDGRFLRVWGAQSAAPGDFKLPLGAATDGLGMLYIGDHFNRRVQGFYVALEGED